jgi:hypothetical protein
MAIDLSTLILTSLLLLPVAILFLAMKLGASQLTLGEWMCLLTVPLTLDFMLGAARIFSGLPEVWGVIPVHVIVLGLYAAIGFAITLHACRQTKSGRWSQRMATAFGLLYFGLVFMIACVAWMAPRI